MNTSALTQAVARLALAPTLMVAAAVLVKGYTDTGDGFAAGVIVALGVLLQYVAFGFEEAERRLRLVRHASLAAVVGLLVALAIAFLPAMRGEPPLTHWPTAGADVVHLGTLEILTAVTFDLGVFLLVAGTVVAAVRLLAAVEAAKR